MPNQRRARTFLMGACMLAVGFGSCLSASAYDPQQSTGTGTVQGDGEIKTERGGHTGEFTSRNEDSGSATGAVRSPSNPEPKAEGGIKPQHEPKGAHESSQKEGSGGKTSPNK